VFASPHDAAVAFVTKTGFRNDDFRPYVYQTKDFGKTWTSIAAGLPEHPVNVIVQDRKNASLLFVGTDRGLHVSLDGGHAWVRFGSLPTVPVHDLLVHPREQDLVVGSYGRGIWVTNIGPLQQMTAEVLTKDAHLFDVRPVAIRTESGWGNYQLYGNRYLTTPNEPNGFVVIYHLKTKPAAKVTVTIADPFGEGFHTAEGPAEAGLNRFVWEPRQPVPGGDYVVTLKTGDAAQTKRTTVRHVTLRP
jgi:hypothetical protein